MSPALNAIVQYSQNVITQAMLIHEFQRLDNAAFYFEREHQSLIHLVLSYEQDETKCAVIIDELLRRAMRCTTLFAYLLTKPNHNGVTPYYSTLYRTDFSNHVATTLSEWLTFAVSMRFITKNHYATVHLVKNMSNEFALHTLAKGGYTHQFEMCLNELAMAHNNGWISSQDHNRILTEQNNTGHRIIDSALGSSCRKTIELMIGHAGINAFSANHIGNTPIHRLVYNGDSQALERCFIEINAAIVRQQIPSSVYSYIFFNQALKVRLLSLSLHRESAETSQVILKYAEIAHTNNWLDSESYNAFLLQHPKATEQFSYIHEALRSSHYQNVYAYIGACLRAVLNKRMTLTSFRYMLQEENKAYFPVFHQAINNEFLETAELILNLFKILLPNEYATALFKRVNREPRCDIVKLHSFEINALVNTERRQIKNYSYETNSIIYFKSDGRILTTGFLELINLINLIAEQETNELIDECSSPTSITALQDSAPIVAMNVNSIKSYYPAQVSTPKVTQTDPRFFSSSLLNNQVTDRDCFLTHVPSI